MPRIKKVASRVVEDLPAFYAQAGNIEALRTSLSESLIRDSSTKSENSRNMHGETLVWIAARYGHTEMVQMLVQDFGVLVDTADARGVTPLIAAAWYGPFETCRMLVECGANVNAAEAGGVTPLIAAAWHGPLEACRMLVQCGADVNAADAVGVTPLIAAACAAWHGHTDMVRMLAEDFGALVDAAALIAAARHGDLETCLMLVQCGADVNAADAEGLTPLIAAAGHGHLETCLMLVQCGADVNAADDQGQTPLIAAAKRGDTETVRMLLLKCRADFNADDDKVATIMLAFFGVSS
jgi:serine/threonine-protein phosphatase 6 regulatory ankyrin repeat subunit B